MDEEQKNKTFHTVQDQWGRLVGYNTPKESGVKEKKKAFFGGKLTLSEPTLLALILMPQKILTVTSEQLSYKKHLQICLISNQKSLHRCCNSGNTVSYNKKLLKVSIKSNVTSKCLYLSNLVLDVPSVSF